MRRLRKFFRGRTAAECFLLLEAATMLKVAQIALRHRCHFQTVRFVILQYGRSTRPVITPLAAEKIIAATMSARARLGLENACLAEAITAEALFAQHGYVSVLCLGVSREEGEFSAHAWVEKDERVVIGGPLEMTLKYTRFTRLPV